MSSTTDTIAAIATPLGAGALAVVKMSGADCVHVACALLQIPPRSLRPRYASLRALYDNNGAILDEVIVLYFKAPHSYTGEDVVEFQCHGGCFVANAILDSVLRFACVRLARPGEFSMRALIAGKMDITQAEAIANLINVKDATSQHLLARQLRGSLRDFIANERQILLEFLATSEVSIDYAEEDLPENLIESISARIHDRIERFERLLDVSRSYERFANGFCVALLGKPNTGKSSLLNALLLRQRAIVSDVAGTTRDTIEESCMIAQHHIQIVDTAGVHESADSLEQQG
ncbi:MAG: tRNA uridine-5-carboxymethylaminomethyl(34) synthesis GTPase MnmE, partial [Helicobacter sp.]|nr:tRNA uridine-5-carboxymethylaminomethyl(34) synthesis GTPase MnmE [Helicobacter sp.]